MCTWLLWSRSCRSCGTAYLPWQNHMEVLKVFIASCPYLVHTWFASIWFTFWPNDQRLQGCLACGPNTCACHSKLLGKTIYVKHRKWLRTYHPFQSNACDFNGRFERSAPPIMSGHDLLEHANAYESWKLNNINEDDNPCVKTGVKPKSFLFVHWWTNRF
jgi:hypothetical protein